MRAVYDLATTCIKLRFVSRALWLVSSALPEVHPNHNLPQTIVPVLVASDSLHYTTLLCQWWVLSDSRESREL